MTNSYAFNTYVTIFAENEEQAVRWFDFKTKDLDTYVAEITIVEENI
jgi:hypothetical protein